MRAAKRLPQFLTCFRFESLKSSLSFQFFGSSSHNMEDAKPLVSFGVLTDVQYADRDDCESWYCKEKFRYYRSSLNLIRDAFRTWQNSEVSKVSFVMQLGDLLDGCNHTMNLDSVSAIKKTLAVFEEFPDIPTYHVLGNHELYNFSREEIQQYFGPSMAAHLPGSMWPSMEIYSSEESMELGAEKLTQPMAYYKFSPTPELVFLVLDCYDISMPGYEATHPNFVKAKQLLVNYHNSEDLDKWEYDDHLDGMDKRFLAYNGAIGPKQLHWLDQELQFADGAGQKVIVCDVTTKKLLIKHPYKQKKIRLLGHISVLPESSKPSCIIWNFEEVLSVLHRHTCVVAYLAGHLHDSGYGLDSHGIHHLTFAGIIETAPTDSAFSTLNVFSDRIEVQGYGREKSYNLPFRTENLSMQQTLNTGPVELPVEA